MDTQKVDNLMYELFDEISYDEYRYILMNLEEIRKNYENENENYD